MRTVRITVLAITTFAAACSTADRPTQMADVSQSLPTPPAPPPPPPPPAPQIAVTGSRVAEEAFLRQSDTSAAPSGQLNKLPQGTVAQGRYAWLPPVQVPVDPGRERYDGKQVSPVHVVASDPVSTFSVDVDTGAYANVRRFLTLGSRPPQDAVRTEELINYFRYDYPEPEDRSTPFTVTTDVARTPWNDETRLLRVGLRGYDLPRSARPPANLVFLVDVSGSMNSPDKLPLVKSALTRLAGKLQGKDKVSIVVYAGAAGLVLPATSNTAQIRAALDRLAAGGSTAGGAGLQLAYNVARDNFIQGGVNRVILATDGDFNVGTSDTKALIQMVEKQRDSGITLTTLGFGTGNYNEAMMEQIADHGNGNYAYIDSALEAEKVLSDQMASTLFTIAKDVKIQIEFNPAQVSPYRLIGYENRALRDEDFDNDRVDAGDIGAGHQVTAIYEIVPTGAKGWIGERRYTAEPAASDTASELAYVKLRYKLPDGTTSRLVERAIPAAMLRQAALPRGDMAFATAVAAYGQRLRGDNLLMGYDFHQIVALAGSQDDYWRQEFLKLAGIAGGLDAS